MKKTSKTEVMSIEEITRLYLVDYHKEKEAKKGTDKYKKMILEYAEKNRRAFKEGVLELPGGNVSVEIRKTWKGGYNEDSATLDWLNSALDADLGDAIEVTIDTKNIAERALNAEQQQLLDAISFVKEEKETLAVRVCGKE
jgi:glycerate-2-kinase